MTSIVGIDIDLDLDRVLGAPDPCAALAQERERGWIAASPFGFHVLAFEPAFDLLRDRPLPPHVGAAPHGGRIPQPMGPRLWTTALLGSEPSAHDRLRKLVAPYFTRRAVTQLRELV